MKRSLMFLIFLVSVCLGAFASTSTDYAVSTEVIDLGGNNMTSGSYNIIGKIREVAPVLATSTNYTIEARFLGMSYTSSGNTSETPVVSSIAPNQGYNNKTIRVVINGSNISTDATAKMSRVGATDIPGSDITYESATSIEVTFDLSGKPAGLRTLWIRNEGYGFAGYLANSFNVLSSGNIHIIGTPVNDPNPFDPSTGPTHIKYTLSADSGINLYLFNQLGQLVWQKSYNVGDVGGKAGVNDIIWDASTDFRESVPTGVYLLKIVAKSGRAGELGRIKIAVLRQK